jgi:hypothetical protein
MLMPVLQEPKPETIRPYHVLQTTLLELKKRWREKAPYNWICSQFKSLRQDLTVRLSSSQAVVAYLHYIFTGPAHQERLYCTSL